jgi:hypothetical protein
MTIAQGAAPMHAQHFLLNNVEAGHSYREHAIPLPPLPRTGIYSGLPHQRMSSVPESYNVGSACDCAASGCASAPAPPLLNPGQYIPPAAAPVAVGKRPNNDDSYNGQGLVPGCYGAEHGVSMEKNCARQQLEDIQGSAGTPFERPITLPADYTETPQSVGRKGLGFVMQPASPPHGAYNRRASPPHVNARAFAGNYIHSQAGLYAATLHGFEGMTDVEESNTPHTAETRF